MTMHNRATAIATKVIGGGKTAIDYDKILEIIIILLPHLIECFSPTNGKEASDYISRRYDLNNPKYKFGYDKRLLKATTRQVLQAARKSKTMLGWSTAEQVALAVLDDVREGDVDEATLIILEVYDV
jgi:hypothetical protein